MSNRTLEQLNTGIEKLLEATSGNIPASFPMFLAVANIYRCNKVLTGLKKHPE
ncbi:MAG: hypothetical protein K9J13_17260 [Saprospiraceae bacterium]|nr:hypothetical protein [Saprospiraceae bacterium]